MRLFPLVFVLALFGCPPPDDKPATDTDTDTDADTDFDTDDPPSTPEVAITPAAPTEDQDLVVTILTESVDPEGADITYQYAWTVDGAARADLTTATVSATETIDAQAWVVTVTPNDGALDGVPATASVKIGNRSPVAPTLHIDPTAPQAGDALTLVFDTPATDPDGDALTQTITWYVDESENLGFADRTTIVGGYVDRGEVFRAVVVVTDGFNAPVTAEATTTVGNTPPTLRTPRIEPRGPKDNNDLEVIAAATDMDGEDLAYTYTWYRDGLEATDVGNSVTVPASATIIGEEWTVTVTVSDGTDEVSNSAAAVTILDWDGIVYTQTFTALLENDGTGAFPTATGTWTLDLLKRGGGKEPDDCDLVWAVESVSDPGSCPSCDYAFAATMTLDPTSSVLTTGLICEGLYGDGPAQWTYSSRYPELWAYGYPAGSGYYAGYGIGMYVYGSGGYTGSYYGYEYARYYSVTSTEDIAGDVTVEAYQYSMYRY